MVYLTIGEGNLELHAIIYYVLNIGLGGGPTPRLKSAKASTSRTPRGLVALLVGLYARWDSIAPSDF